MALILILILTVIRKIVYNPALIKSIELKKIISIGSHFKNKQPNEIDERSKRTSVVSVLRFLLIICFSF